MAESQARDTEEVTLPSFRGDMLLLKYLQLRQECPPSLEELPNDFDEFLAPLLDEDFDSPSRSDRSLGYLELLQTKQFARIAERDGSELAEITAVGLLVAGGIGLVSYLRESWERQKQEKNL